MHNTEPARLKGFGKWGLEEEVYNAGTCELLDQSSDLSLEPQEIKKISGRFIAHKSSSASSVEEPPC